MLVVASVNVNGIRAATPKGLAAWLARTRADVVCLQQTRAATGEVPAELSASGRVDVVRARHGDVDGPYSWWSDRGRAFDDDAGRRIDLHVATPGLAARAGSAVVERAASHTERRSDRAPVVVAYR